jgi:ATP-binding cassette subfamily B protein
MAFTNKKIYKLLDGKLLDIFDITSGVDFKTEVMYGSGGFYAKINGVTTLLCQFVIGRNLPRYAVMVKACEVLSETGREESLVNNTPETYCGKCGRPYLYGSEICPFCVNKLEVYGKLWAMTKGLRFSMFFPFIVAGIGILAQFISPIIGRIIMDDYLRVEFVPDNYIIGFVFWVSMTVLIDFFQRVLGVAEAWLLAVASGKFLMLLRTLLYEKIQALSLASIQRRSTGELMNRVSSDTGVIQNFIINELPTIFRQVISLPVAIIVLLIMNWKIALLVAVPVPFVVFIVSRFWGFVHGKNIKMWLLSVRLSYLLQDVLNGIRVVKSFGQENSEIEKYDDANEKAANQDETIYMIWSTRWPLIAHIMWISYYISIWYMGTLIIGGNITLGEYNQLFSYMYVVYAPLIALTYIPNSLSTFLTSSSKVFEILEETPEIKDVDLPMDIKIEGDISIKKATFGYHSYNPVLENIDFEIKAGEMIGIVGHSGSGKTTLINLLMRLYDVNDGEIIIDDVNIKDISQEALRSQIGVVLQESFLFAGTIRDNIKYSKPYATDEEIIAAARVANAHDFIVNLPDGYNTMVGEKGYSMSGGERQRITIARAVIHNPSILILDEATASLDTETENMIQDSLNKLSKNRTTIAIAHRLSTLRNADRLLVLDKGRVAEHGTHKELLAMKGIYYKLVMAQREMAHHIIGEEDDDD